MLAFDTLFTDMTGSKILKQTTASTVTVTESLVRISCGGTSNVTVRRSMTIMLSIHGRMKKRPGPLAPPDWTRPNRYITALWYSCTIQYQLKISTVLFTIGLLFSILTFTQNKRLKGNVNTTSMKLIPTKIQLQQPKPSFLSISSVNVTNYLLL